MQPDDLTHDTWTQVDKGAEVDILRVQVRRCHALLQDAEALLDPEAHPDTRAEIARELDGTHCPPGGCTDACETQVETLRAFVRAFDALEDLTANRYGIMPSVDQWRHARQAVLDARAKVTL